MACIFFWNPQANHSNTEKIASIEVLFETGAGPYFLLSMRRPFDRRKPVSAPETSRKVYLPLF